MDSPSIGCNPIAVQYHIIIRRLLTLLNDAPSFPWLRLWLNQNTGLTASLLLRKGGVTNVG